MLSATAEASGQVPGATVRNSFRRVFTNADASA
jgi:hypothetical protein